MYAKVIVVCGELNRKQREGKFPAHTGNIKTEEDLHRIWEKILVTELLNNSGVAGNTIIVCNGNKAYEWWSKVSYVDLKNGRLLVDKRENDGGSFAGYNYAYSRYKSMYDGFIFTEEDILINGDRYYQKILDDYRGGFMCLVDKSLGRVYPVHCHGGVGYASTEELKKVEDGNGDLPHPKNKGWDQKHIVKYGEAPFTNIFIEKGMELYTPSWHKKEWCKSNLCYPYNWR